LLDILISLKMSFLHFACADEEETFQTGANGENRAIAAHTFSPLPLFSPVQ
jgi:hypothetical protein